MTALQKVLGCKLLIIWYSRFCGINIMEKDPRISLTLSIPRESQMRFRLLIGPLLSWIDPKFEIVQFIEQDNSKLSVVGQRKFWYHPCNDKLSTPAIAVMLFLPEHGKISCRKLENIFGERSWTLHHIMELKKKTSPGVTVATQQFYQMSPDLPLWSVCPSVAGQGHLRITIFVVNFRKMVEFYRLVTEVEMESSKPGFCIFQLRLQNNINIQLSLKHCPSLQPQHLHQTCLHFKVRNIRNYKCLIKSEIVEVSTKIYSVLDPDGNRVQLTDVEDHVIGKSLGIIPYSVPSHDRQLNNLIQSNQWRYFEKGPSKNTSCERADQVIGQSLDYNSYSVQPHNRQSKNLIKSNQWRYFETSCERTHEQESDSSDFRESPSRKQLCNSAECPLCETPTKKQSKISAVISTRNKKNISETKVSQIAQKQPLDKHCSYVAQHCAPATKQLHLQFVSKSGCATSYTDSLDSDSDLLSIANQNKWNVPSTCSSGFCETEEESEFEDPWEGSQYNESVNGTPAPDSKNTQNAYCEQFYILPDQCYPIEISKR